MIKAVIFDMDGTLADTDHFIKKSIKKRLADLGLPHSDIYSKKKTLIEFWAEIKEKRALSDPIESLIQKNREVYWAMLAGIRPLPGVINTLKKLKKQKIKIGLATGAAHKSIQTILGELKIESYFDVIVSTHDVAKSKPKPDVYLETAKRLGVLPSECTAIENEMKGIAAAKAAGMKCIGVKTCAFEELKADIILDSLEKFEVDIL